MPAATLAYPQYTYHQLRWRDLIPVPLELNQELLMQLVHVKYQILAIYTICILLIEMIKSLPERVYIFRFLLCTVRTSTVEVINTTQSTLLDSRLGSIEIVQATPCTVK